MKTKKQAANQKSRPAPRAAKKYHDVSVIILTRNEINGLQAVYPRIPFNTVKEVFAVDGKSSDGTIEFFKSKKIPVIVQEKMGRGEAFRIASQHAKGKHMIFFSPDGNEDPADIPKIAALLEQGNDMVIASRFMPGSRSDDSEQLIPYRGFGNRFFTWLANKMFHGNVTDTINGYRGISKQAFAKIKPDAEGFGIEFQMTIRALKHKMKIIEIPTQEGDRIGGHSTAGTFSTGSYFLKLLWREWRSDTQEDAS